jgi:hypothetical protein
MELAEGIDSFIKYNPGYIKTSRRHIQTLEPFMHIAKAKKKRIVLTETQVFESYMGEDVASRHNQKFARLHSLHSQGFG